MITTQQIEYAENGKTMVGHLASPVSQRPCPGVLIGHEGIGLNDFQRARADRLAEHGYVAFAMDYHAGQWFSDPAEMMAVLDPLIADPERMREIGDAALNVLINHATTDPSRVAAIGYGAGGSIALELGRSGACLRAVATVNPVLPSTRPERWANLTCPVLIGVGSDDPLIPPQQLHAFADAMRAAGADWQLVIYGGAEHAFHLPPLNRDGTLSARATHEEPVPGISYHHAHAQRSWRAILNLLKETMH